MMRMRLIPLKARNRYSASTKTRGKDLPDQELFMASERKVTLATFYPLDALFLYAQVNRIFASIADGFREKEQSG